MQKFENNMLIQSFLGVVATFTGLFGLVLFFHGTFHGHTSPGWNGERHTVPLWNEIAFGALLIAVTLGLLLILGMCYGLREDARTAANLEIAEAERQRYASQYEIKRTEREERRAARIAKEEAQAEAEPEPDKENHDNDEHH